MNPSVLAELQNKFCKTSNSQEEAEEPDNFQSLDSLSVPESKDEIYTLSHITLNRVTTMPKRRLPSLKSPSREKASNRLKTDVARYYMGEEVRNEKGNSSVPVNEISSLTATSDESTCEENTPSLLDIPVTHEVPSFPNPFYDDVTSSVTKKTISATSREFSMNEEGTTAILNDTNNDDVAKETTFHVEETSSNIEAFLTHDGTAIKTIVHEDVSSSSTNQRISVTYSESPTNEGESETTRSDTSSEGVLVYPEVSAKENVLYISPENSEFHIKERNSIHHSTEETYFNPCGTLPSDIGESVETVNNTNPNSTPVTPEVRIEGHAFCLTDTNQWVDKKDEGSIQASPGVKMLSDCFFVILFGLFCAKWGYVIIPAPLFCTILLALVEFLKDFYKK